MALKKLLKSGYPVVLGGTSQKTNPYVGSMGLLDIQGFHLDESGALTRWNGFKVYQTTPSIFSHAGELTPDLTGLFLFLKSDGTRFEIATTKTKIWRFGNPTANEYNELSLANSGFGAAGTGANRTGTVNDKHSFAVLKDILYMFNGIDPNIMYDGVNIQSLGIQPVAGNPVAQNGGAGVLTGTYSHKITYYNSLKGIESSPSVKTNDFTASSNQINVLAFPTPDNPQVDKIRIYRTTADGGVWLFNAEIPSNQGSYIDNLPDSQLGIQVELLANGVPPAFQIAEIHKGRLFGVPSNSSRVWFSKQGKPNAVHPNDFRDLDPDDGDRVVTGIKRLFGQIIAFKNDSIWNGSGSDRFDFSFNRQVSGVGAVNQESILTVPGKNIFMFMSENGFYSYDGVTERYESQQIEPLIKGLNQSRLKYTHGFAYKKLNMLIWLVSNGASTKNDLMVVYDYVQNMWTTRSLSNAKMAANVAAIIEGVANDEEFLTGGYDSGEVYQGDIGDSDNGALIATSVTDRAIPRQDSFPDLEKSFNRIVIFFKPYTGSKVRVSYAVNDPDGTFISLGIVGTSDASGQASIRFNARGRRIYFKIEGAEA